MPVLPIHTELPPPGLQPWSLAWTGDGHSPSEVPGCGWGAGAQEATGRSSFWAGASSLAPCLAVSPLVPRPEGLPPAVLPELGCPPQSGPPASGSHLASQPVRSGGRQPAMRLRQLDRGTTPPGSTTSLESSGLSRRRCCNPARSWGRDRKTFAGACRSGALRGLPLAGGRSGPPSRSSLNFCPTLLP